MTDVRLLGAVAYQSKADCESPWGCTDYFRDDLMDWLDERVGAQGWDHDIDFASGDCIVTIEDPKIALLFKLTWGGV